LNFKLKVLSGDAVHGSWVNLGSLVSAEIMGRAGFDWLLIDLEHGAGNDTMMYHQLQVLESTYATPIVRTDELSRPKVQRILDAGAKGIMFPQIQNKEEAELAVNMMYYPPRGIRGMAKMVRATGFGKNADEYIASLDKNLVGVMQIENINALKDIEAIAAIPGADVLFVGPSDLSLALGIFGQFNHPAYQQAMQDVAGAAKKHGKAAGVLLQNIDEYEMYYHLGFRFLACGADGSFVARSAEALVKQMKERL
jgi:4-hydroxy-2-oxoheptanedioate aldolase